MRRAIGIRKWIFLSVFIILVSAIAAACSGADSEPGDTSAAEDVSTSAQDAEYFRAAIEAQALAESKFSNFREVFNRTWPVRSALITALLEAGVGTAFVETLQALNQIEPPTFLQDPHLKLVESVQQLADLDAEAREAVENGDLAAFVFINGQLGELSVSTSIELPGAFCNGLNPAGSHLCSPTETVPGEEYGARLIQLMREFQPKFVGATGAMGFSLSLSQEEVAQVFSTLGPEVESILAEIRESLGALTPLSEFNDDHQRLISYFEGMADGFSQITEAGMAGEVGRVDLEFPNLIALICDAQGSFSSPEFESLIRVHFGDAADMCSEEPF